MLVAFIVLIAMFCFSVGFFVLIGKYLKLRKQYRSTVDEETEELHSYGFYNPHFNFDTSERYKEEILKIRELQKNEIKEGTAAA